MSDFLLLAGRSLLSFIVIFTIARYLGKKQLSQLTFFDYVVGIVIGDMGSTLAIEREVKVWETTTGLITYTLCAVVLTFAATKSFKFRDLVESSPSLLIKDGKIMEKTLKKNRISFDDLLNGLREQGVFDLQEVEMAILETNGQITVLPKPEYRPVTLKDLNIKVDADHGPSLVILEGLVMEKRLNYLGYTKEWLLEEVKKQGATSFDDVFLAQINSSGEVYVDLLDDTKKLEQDEQKPNLAARLRKIQLEIETMALQANDQNAKKMYMRQSEEIDKIIKKINPYLS